MKQSVRMLLPAIASVVLDSGAVGETVSIEIDGLSAAASQGARRLGRDIEIRNGFGVVRSSCSTDAGGPYQVWLSYACSDDSGRCMVTIGSKRFSSPLKDTAEDGQYCRLHVGDARLTGDAGVSTRIVVEASAKRFRFHRLELVQVPVLHPELEPLFESAIDFYDRLVRTPNGLYRDAHRVGQVHVKGGGITSNRAVVPERVCSTAAVGVGLMTLCMSHELGRDPLAEQKALQTLRVLNGKVAGLRLDREQAGFYRHFVDSRTGTGKSEYSTIDTAILVVGALFCRNTFDSDEIRDEADQLWNSIEWPLAVENRSKGRFYMAFSNGKPLDDAVTTLFNEYYILAWLIEQCEIQRHGSSDLLSWEPRTWAYRDMTLLCSRTPRPQCSFIVQFPFYMCHKAANSRLYFSYVAAQARADHMTCSERLGVKEFWGCGAGGTPNDGYHASNYGDNPGNVVSPRIIAGFMPAFPQAQDHLLKLYRDPERRLRTEVGDLLPRFSPDEHEWRHHRIEAIDFASMLFGLAGIHPKLGRKFFQDRTRMTFNQVSK